MATSWESTKPPETGLDESQSPGGEAKRRPPDGHCMPFAWQEKERRLCFLQFLSGLLRLNPDLRWTPKQAIRFFAAGDGENPFPSKKGIQKNLPRIPGC